MNEATADSRTAIRNARLEKRRGTVKKHKHEWKFEMELAGKRTKTAKHYRCKVCNTRGISTDEGKTISKYSARY